MLGKRQRRSGQQQRQHRSGCHAQLAQRLADRDFRQRGEIPERADHAGDEVGLDRVVAHQRGDVCVRDQRADEAHHKHATKQQRHEQLGKVPGVVHPLADLLAVHPTPDHQQHRQAHRASQIPASVMHGDHPRLRLVHPREVALRQRDLVPAAMPGPVLLELKHHLIVRFLKRHRRERTASAGRTITSPGLYQSLKTRNADQAGEEERGFPQRPLGRLRLRHAPPAPSMRSRSSRRKITAISRPMMTRTRSLQPPAKGRSKSPAPAP